MKVHCPNCKSDIIKTESRLKYFVRSASCFAIVILSFLLFNSMGDDDADTITTLGFYVFLIFAGLSVVFGINYIIKGLRVKETSYECEYCTRKFKDPFARNLVS